ncbi:MAG: methylated-DNA--[protein]-cysteine S-methyltransferase [Acidimicrobiales bacterium]
MTTTVTRRTHPSPLGTLTLVASDAGLRAVLFPEERPGRVVIVEADAESEAAPEGRLELLERTARQLDEYFAGDRHEFDLELDPVGTPFQLRAWEALRRIPYGATGTYGEQAVRMGSPSAVRAVGAANGRNPISIIVPCHRVVGADGTLTGYAGGMDAKRFLLDLEAGERRLFG